MAEDEKETRAFNCLADLEMPALGFNAITAAQASATGGHGVADSLCCACTAMVMLHAAAAAVVAADVEDPINREEFLKLAAVVFDAHKTLSAERLDRMREIYARSVARGLFERKIRGAIRDQGAAALSAAISSEAPKEKMH